MKQQTSDPKEAFIFVVKQQYRQLTRIPNEAETEASAESELKTQAAPIELTTLIEQATPTKKMSFAELVQCACFPLAAKSKSRMLDVISNTSLYTHYEWILAKMSIAQSLEQVAASTSTTLLSRSTDKFDLQIKPDKSNSAQAHLLLSLKHTNASATDYPKGVFLHCVADTGFEVVHFENVLDQQAQIMIEQGSRTFELVTNPNTKLYLC